LTALEEKKAIKETYQSLVNSELLLKAVCKADRDIILTISTPLKVVCKSCIKHSAISCGSKSRKEISHYYLDKTANFIHPFSSTKNVLDINFFFSHLLVMLVF